MLGDEVRDIKTEVYTDSKNLHRAVLGTSLAGNPRLRTEVAKLQQSLEIGELGKLTFVQGREMLADCLTKKGACASKLISILKKCE